MSYILITGASSGIGLSLAKKYAERGEKLILVARRLERLQVFQQQFPQTEIFQADLSKEESAKCLYDWVKEKNFTVKTLVNNAGVGLFGDFIETDLNKELAMINLNIKSLVSLSKYFSQVMIKQGGGEIINVSSIASFMPGPQMSVYYATKAFVTSFSQALAFELRDTPVKVRILAPGPTATEFEKAASLETSNLFERLKVMPAEEVAEMVLSSQKTLIIPGIRNKFSVFLGKYCPVKWVMTVVNKIQGKK